jgi:type III restriction enzyme
MGKENAKNKDRIFVGGVILPIEVNGVLTWRYCRNKIEDTKDLTGWDFFNPATMNG